MRGDTLAEGIAVKAPGGLTTEIIRRLVDDIVLVTEDEIERAVAMLIAIEKTVVEGAGAAGLAAVLANAGALCRPQCRPRADRRQHRYAADRLGADPRTRARGPADADFASTSSTGRASSRRSSRCWPRPAPTSSRSRTSGRFPTCRPRHPARSRDRNARPRASRGRPDQIKCSRIGRPLRVAARRCRGAAMTPRPFVP